MEVSSLRSFKSPESNLPHLLRLFCSRYRYRESGKHEVYKVLRGLASERKVLLTSCGSALVRQKPETPRLQRTAIPEVEGTICYR